MLGAVVAAMACAATASAASLYTQAAPRPGPDVLYAPAPDPAPQLTNSGIWAAEPILVSGTTAYRDGEFVYQDFLYDDHGARHQPDPGDPRNPGDLFSKPNGTYTYPDGEAYAANAADLVEFRVKPQQDATAFRITLNTLKDPSKIALGVAIGGTPGAALPFPHGANVRAPADMFLTVKPNEQGVLTGELVQAGTNTPIANPTVTTDMERRQIEVRISRAAFDPQNRTVRLAAGIGLWDQENDRYLLPRPAANETTPGGSGANPAPAAFFNVAFRTDEDLPVPTDHGNPAASPATWRDKDQGAALANGDITPLHAVVDFGKLAAGTDDDSAIPTTGPINRILTSAHETGQGADWNTHCILDGAGSGGVDCKGQLLGRLQPYAIYVPTKPAPQRGYGMTLLLHSLSANYNQYLGSRNQSQLGERGPGSIVITPEGRGPDGFYDGLAAVDTFEVWADVARRYALDPRWTVTSGYSMGGIGSFKLAEQFPDLFARLQSTVGASTDNNLVPSLRNMPVLMWNAVADELVPVNEYEATARALDDAGYRYELDVFTADHFVLGANDEYGPAAAFLGTHRVNRNPPHVTFVRAPKLDYPQYGFVADHAYWLSDIRLREPDANQSQGTIDVRSRGFGVGDPEPSGTQLGAGTLTGGTFPALAYQSQSQTWGQIPPGDKQDVLDVTAKNVGTVTVNARRAKVTCRAHVNLESDGPTDVRLTGCSGLPKRCTDRRRFRFRFKNPRGLRVEKVVVRIDGKRTQARRGRSIRTLRIRRLPRSGRFRVKIVATLNTGVKSISTRTYQGCRKSRPRTRSEGRRGGPRFTG